MDTKLYYSDDEGISSSFNDGQQMKMTIMIVLQMIDWAIFRSEYLLIILMR